MALKLIGAVGLKVRPEAENFRDEAERDIKRQMRGADRDGYKYPIKPEVDKDHFRRELNKSNQDLRNALGDMQRQVDKKQLDLRVNNDKFRRDTEKVKDIYGAMFRDMERRKRIFGDSKAFSLDTEEFEEDLRKVRHQFEQAVRDMDGEDVDVKPVLDETSLRAVWARIKWLTRDRFATIHVRLNKASVRAATNAMKALYGASGARTGIDFIKDFGRYLRDIDKHLPTIAMVGTVATAAVGGVTALVGSVAHLANEFVRMAGAGLALPGILGGFAVGIGAMVAVMKDFNREVPKVGQDLSKLQDQMSDNFWQQAKVPFLEAWNKAFPHFSRGIKKTSTELGKWTAAFSEAFSTHFDMSAFDKMFANLNKSISIASEGVGDFVKAMSILGQTGSEYLPKLARWGNDVAKSFANWLEEGQKTGKLNDIIDTGIQKMKEFGKLTRETGQFVYILGTAAERAGFSGFGEMADGMERFNDKLNTSKGREVLDDIFDGAAHVADGFKRALGAVGDFVWNSSAMLKDLAEIISDMVGDTFEKMFKAFERPKFQNGLTDLFQGISDGISEITDRAPEIADLLGSVGKLGGEVAENMGKVVGKILEVFGPEISDALEDIAPDMEKIGDSITSMMDHLDAAGFDDFVGSLIRASGAQLGQLATDLDGVAVAIEAISKLGKGDFAGLKELNEEVKQKDTEYQPLPGFGWTKNVGEALAKALRTASATIKTALSMWTSLLQGDIRGAVETAFDTDIGQWIIEKLTGQKVSGKELVDALGLNGDFSHDFGVIMDGMKEQLSIAIEGAREWISTTWTGFTDWLGNVFNFDGAFAFDDWFPGVVDWWNEQIQEIVDMFNTAKDWIVEAWTGFTDWLTGLFSGSGDTDTTAPGSGGAGMQTSIFDQFGIDSWGDTFAQKLNQARVWISETWEGFKSWLGGLFGGGEGDGSAMQVAIDFVMNAIDNASDIIIQIVNRAREWVANTWQGVLTALDNARTTIQNVKDKALDYARNKYQAALTAIDNARSTIQNVKNKALDYARSKYQAALTALDKARGIISQVKNQALNYARSKYEAVLKALDRASSVVNSVQRKIDSLRGKTVDIVTNMVTKVKKIFSADGNYMPGVKKFADGGIEKHVAQIAPAGAMRVWAEPETGGEAYIPLANSKRARSEQILSTVADKFGMRLERYANGSNPGTAQQISSGGDTVNITVESVPTDSAEEVSSAIWFDYKHMKRGNAFAFA